MNKIEKITSRDNRRLIDLRKIRDGKINDKIFIEGRRLAAEALRSNIEIRYCFVAEGFHDIELAAAAAERGALVCEVPERLFRSVADTRQPQGIIIIAERPLFDIDSISLRIASARLPIVVFLKEINNPSNLGAIVRTAEAAGAIGVIVSKGSADVFSPKALRSAMGSSFRLPVWENAEFSEVLGWAKVHDLVTVAADILGTSSYTDIDWRIPSLLIFGSEAHGLGELELAAIDKTVLIPMENGVESLNLAVSAGIILFEARRQKHFARETR